LGELQAAGVPAGDGAAWRLSPRTGRYRALTRKP